MHVSSSQFRAVRRDGVLLRFALLGPVAYAVADFPESGSRGTFVEEWCTAPHWAFTVRGALTLDLDGDRREIGPGTAFHVPAGVRHRLIVPGEARVAGFDRLGEDTPTEDEALARAGYEIVRGRALPRGRVAVEPSRPDPPPAPAEVRATSRRMGDLLFTRASLGPTTGYTSAWCDVPHWGLVAAGRVAIEWEDSVEVLGAGDVYHCPAGPPGHRILAADPATIVDFTPVDPIRSGARLSDWRRAAAEAALAVPEVPARLELVALA